MSWYLQERSNMCQPWFEEKFSKNKANEVLKQRSNILHAFVNISYRRLLFAFVSRKHDFVFIKYIATRKFFPFLSNGLSPFTL